MARQEKIVLWIDRRWKDAIEKHLRDETLEEHLEDVLDELCNQLPEREYARISKAIQAESTAAREREEAAPTWSAYRVLENGEEWCFKVAPGEELLNAAERLNRYLKEPPDTGSKFIRLFSCGTLLTSEEYQQMIAERMENTGKVRGVFDVNFDKREFSAVHIMDGWRTWAMQDMSAAVYHATRSQFASSDDQWRKLLDHLSHLGNLLSSSLAALENLTAEVELQASQPPSAAPIRPFVPEIISNISSDFCLRV